MKKLIFATCLILSILVVAPLNAQKSKKESKKEKKERIARWVDEQCKNQTLFVGITRLAPKDGVAQNIIYGNDGYFLQIEGDKLSCNLPYIAVKGNTGHLAYNTEDNLYLNADNQQFSIYGGWQEDKKMYAYQINFINYSKSKDVEKVPIVLILGIYQTGECIINAQWPGMNTMTYMGQMMEKPAEK